MPIEWETFSRREFDVVFAAIGRMHEDLIRQVGDEETRTPGLFAACHHITNEMHRANDDLARRETAALKGDLSVLR
ncbi:hypothetical protein [Microbacterium sp. Leaf320]|uniref:hypothetical protein n=1 Tax=Microbacterium sp. Leaf320 TaxID=1736334 RepID=UPI0006F5626A|nr:hypothetical protein [Microbacterium sp. Leaf320]KQQ65042.1 hypothetical protein ASF63_13805 [Microbacterium sp. Leaf320]